MQVIPVIDLKDGQVVHARGGQRAGYQPLRSRLCQGSAPLDVVRGYLAFYAFTSLYVADLDAIEGQGDNQAAIFAIREILPTLDLWVDRGLVEEKACQAWLRQDCGRLVVGSESQTDERLLLALTSLAAMRVILSLDFRDDEFLGPAILLEEPDLWPPTVIVMTLARVGGGQGPDLERLRWVKQRAGGRRIFAAGGLRGAEDLQQLGAQGADGILTASALHDGRLQAEHLAALQRPCDPL